MIDSGQHQERQANSENQHATTTRLMVGSHVGYAGEVSVVEANTGHVCWQQRTGRIYEAFALDDHAAYLAPGGSFALQQRLQRAESDSAEWHRVAAQLDTPTQLEARRASDGALLWTQVHPLVTGQMQVEVDSGVVVAANPRHFKDGAPDIQAFDAADGRPLWTLGTLGQLGSHEDDAQLIRVCGGRVYTQLTASREQITAFDIHSGRQLWERPFNDYWVFSPSGALIGEQRYDDDRPRVTIIDAHNGSEISSFSTDGVIRQLTDDGIAYVDGNTYEDATWIAAVDARTGEELWRTHDVPHDHLALDDAVLSFSRIIPEKGNVEIGALDTATGERLWQWHSPDSLGELLRLWGPRRMPAMLWDSTEKSVATIRDIVWRPWFRLRRPLLRVGIPQRRRTPGKWLRDIRQSIASSVGWPLWHEFTHGHWRQPWQVDSAMNANWLAARWGIVFLGTWLGLFALDAATGQLLWHALPTIDLSFVDPALAP
ncbi:MAG TPA: PQQ-binding-like beta-propeller repeat protein [Ktedonobacterales bacterium]|nr:PQQ-binding-like beta-propeller repeat protein [Ktedonobacterales bacterium]